MILSSRRTESRNLTGDGKVGGSCTSPRVTRYPVGSRQLARCRREEQEKKEATVNGQT
jgi:hypothetical protein